MPYSVVTAQQACSTEMVKVKNAEGLFNRIWSNRSKQLFDRINVYGQIVHERLDNITGYRTYDVKIDVKIVFSKWLLLMTAIGSDRNLNDSPAITGIRTKSLY